MSQPFTLVTVARYPDGYEASIVAGMLESHGIRVVLGNSIMSSVLPIGFNSIGGVRLQVNAVDADRARRLIASHNDYQS